MYGQLLLLLSDSPTRLLHVSLAYWLRTTEITYLVSQAAAFLEVGDGAEI